MPAWGATPDDWATFDMVLGLTADLLPVVSNPHAVISPQSKMKGLGKTPSWYRGRNGNRHVTGIVDWTSHVTTGEEITVWSQEPDYGLCLQARTVRAIDNDIQGKQKAAQVEEFIRNFLGVLLPTRSRSNSGKCLLAFRLSGTHAKRVIKTTSGIIEFLANGQQFIVAGTHPSGARYEWFPQLTEIPELSLERFNALWQALSDTFGDGTVDSRAPTATRREVLLEAQRTDPVAQILLDRGMVKSSERDGRMHIECPWSAEHSEQEGSESATTYFPANTGGYASGNFKCLHAHCAERNLSDLQDILGLSSAATADDFDNLEESDRQGSSTSQQDLSSEAESPSRFKVKSTAEFLSTPPLVWLVQGVIPRAELLVMYGATGSGKTFIALDLAAAIAQGLAWRNRRVTKARVIYVCAEGAGGFRKRVHAYELHNNVVLPIGIIDGPPNMLLKADALELAKMIHSWGPVDLIIIDTLAQVMPGGDENSGKDISTLFAHCKGLHRATGGTVMLLHHTGKDESRGARGHSSIKGNVDAEYEVVRSDDDRALVITKMKDDAEGDEFSFKLAKIELGTNADGDEISSCIVVEGHKSIEQVRKAKVPMDVNSVVVWDTLLDHVSIGQSCIEQGELVELAAAALPEPEPGKKDGRAHAAQKGLLELLKRAKIKVEDNQVFIRDSE